MCAFDNLLGGFGFILCFNTVLNCIEIISIYVSCLRDLHWEAERQDIN